LQPAATSKTNAARASHPSRIVIADALTAVFREAKDHRATAPLTVPCCDVLLRLALQGYDSALSILLGRRISEEAAKPGHRHTGHAPNSPDDSLSKTIGNAEPLFGTDTEHLTLLTFCTLGQRGNECNVKVRLDCVKTVEQRNFLWKGKEKHILIRADR
jgi:hypothetical protein